MSNRNSDEKSEHRKSKVSLAMIISQGLGGPKAKPKGVADGQPVNIPAPKLFFTEVRSLVGNASYWILVADFSFCKNWREACLRTSEVC